MTDGKFLNNLHVSHNRQTCSPRFLNLLYFIGPISLENNIEVLFLDLAFMYERFNNNGDVNAEKFQIVTSIRDT